MSIHKSLYIDKFKNKQRSIRTRLERIRELISKGKKIEEIDLYNLPKEKIVRIKKIKDEKEKEVIDLASLVTEKKKEETNG